MAQRTYYVVKKNYADGKTETNFIYCHWGIGKCMTARFMQEYLAMDYPIKGDSYNKGLVDYFNFGITKSDKTVTENIDVWNKAVLVQYLSKFDINNGALVMEITEVQDKSEHKVKLGFLLGNEETADIGCGQEPYTRFVSAREYQVITGGAYCSEQWLTCFDNFLKYAEIEEVIDDIEPQLKEALSYFYYQWEHGLYGGITVKLDPKMLDEKALNRYKRLDSKEVTPRYTVYGDGKIKIEELDMYVPIMSIIVPKTEK